MLLIKLDCISLMGLVFVVAISRGVLVIRYGGDEYIERRFELAGAPEPILWLLRRRHRIDSAIGLACVIVLVLSSVGLIVSTRAT